MAVCAYVLCKLSVWVLPRAAPPACGWLCQCPLSVCLSVCGIHAQLCYQLIQQMGKQQPHQSGTQASGQTAGSMDQAPPARQEESSGSRAARGGGRF